jgi:hypothetical protein
MGEAIPFVIWRRESMVMVAITVEPPEVDKDKGQKGKKEESE